MERNKSTTRKVSIRVERDISLDPVKLDENLQILAEMLANILIAPHFPDTPQKNSERTKQGFDRTITGKVLRPVPGQGNSKQENQ